MKRPWILVLGVALLASACSRTKPVESGGSANPSPPVSASETARDQPTIKIANWEQTQQLVAQNPGKVVVLDLWASW